MSVIMKVLRVNAITEIVRSSLTTSCSLCSKSVIPRKPLRKRETAQKKLMPPRIFSDHEFTHNTNSTELNNEASIRMLHSTSVKDLTSIEEILEKHPQKVKDLSMTFNIPLIDTAVLFQKYKFLPNSKMSTINSKINFLVEKGIPKEELLNDLWILTYNIPTLEKRMNLLIDLNLKPIKPWLLRCSDQMLRRMSMNRESNRLAMGSYKTVTDYLKERLHISDSQILYFASRYPPVMRVKVAKLKEIIDFLYSEGFSSNQIYQTPRILCHSLLTIQQRLKELRDLNYELHSLAILCRSKRYFRKILINVEKENRS